MRVFGATKRQAIWALWRGVLLCLVLVATFAHSEDAFGVRSGQEAQHLHTAQAMMENPNLHPDGACQGLGHCAPVFTNAPLALTIVQPLAAPIIFAYADAPAVLGRTVDPGQHPPRLSQAI